MQKIAKAVLAVLPAVRIGERTRRHVAEAEGIVEVAVQQQPPVGADRGTADAVVVEQSNQSRSELACTSPVTVASKSSLHPY